MGFLFLGLQNAVVIYILFLLIRSFSTKKREQRSFQNTFRAIEIGFMILLIFCFVFYEASSFRGEDHFMEFTIITCFSVIAYWANKSALSVNKPLQFTISVFSGTFFWLSIFVVIKFLPYLPWVWFPLLGLLALAPVLLAVMSLSEIYHVNKTQHNFPFLPLILFGLVPIVLLQLAMNAYTPESWEFFKLFDPSNTRV